MLVLSRRQGQTIRLPDLDIEISILKTQGGRVQIGIQAPQEITIRRGELTIDSTVAETLSTISEVVSIPPEQMAVDCPSPANQAMTIRSECESYFVA